ncbi:MAG: sugar ABC transporter permease [Anaerolineales bacterium]|nr:sugar ABC transporter permease [Anaerolineales bacterium]
MYLAEQVDERGPGPATKVVTFILRLALAIAIPIIAFVVLYAGFVFLRAGDAPKWLITVVAIVWGVGGVAALYWIFNWIVEMLPEQWTGRLQPFIFIGPAIAILTWYLAVPTVRTFVISLFDRDGMAGGNFVGLSNYVAVFTDRLMREAFRNNIFMWILIATPLTVVLGLLVAILADRSRFERVAKSLIFMPMAISFVGAGVIWNFMYEVKPADSPQIGLLNAIAVGLGSDPIAWTAHTAISPWNNLFLVIIVAWLQAGFAMVLFSAALKGIPDEILEAARVDGATEVQVFFKIMIPYIVGTIITVTTTIIIFTLKIFDVVWVMTGAQFGTGVIATQFYRQSFTARNAGYGSAIAIVLLIAVIPVMIYNLRQFRRQEAF